VGEPGLCNGSIIMVGGDRLFLDDMGSVDKSKA
jgi:hypothetical protein